MEMRLLLVVNEVVEASRVGVVVGPSLVAGEAMRWTTFDVELRLPDGERRQAKALVTRWPRRPGVQVTLIDLTSKDVPFGTEVWALE
jgi:hypothetical protein